MPKTAAEFLNDLDERGLAPPGVIASLKGQVAKAASPVAPAAIAKLLVEKGHLTQAQAQQLLAATPAAAKKPEPAAAKKTAPQLAPLDDLQPLSDLQPLDDLQPVENLQPLDDLTPLDDVAPAAAVIPLDDLGPLDPLAGTSPAKAARPGPGTAASKQRTQLQPAPAVAQPAKRKSSLGVVLVVLLLLALIGGGAAGAFFLIPRGGGEEAFAAAEKDYQAKQYDAAAAKYDAFLSDYPASKEAATARVHRAAAKVLAARANSPQNWQPVLAAAKESLPPVVGAAEFAQVQADLAPLVTDMAAGLADEAGQGAAAADKVAAAHEALALAGDGRLVPGSTRQWQRLEMAEENVARAAYNFERTKAVADGGAAIKKAAEAGDVAAALAERAKLLAAYPDAASDSSLRDLGPALAQAAAGKVQTSEYSAAAETGERKTNIVGTLVCTTPIKRVAASEAGPPVAFAAAGSVWGLDSATGRVLWRRPASGTQQVVALTSDAASDVVYFDGAASELVRAAARSGQIQWRHKLSAPLAGSPLISGSRVLAATRTGQVVALDVQSGAGQLSGQLPQAARIGPIAVAAGQQLVQLADQSLLYVLSAADLKCVRAVYVGHEPACLAVAPTLLPKHLVAIENRGSATSALHVLILDAGGLPQSVVQQIELPGHVLAPPAVLAGRLVLATDQGRVLAYESAADPTAGLKEVAKAEAGSTAGITRYPLVIDNNLLIAGQGLRQFGPPVGGAMKPAWSSLGDDVLLSPPQVAGDTLVTIRRQPGSPGIVAAGLSRADGKPRWETRLAEPLTSVVLSSDGSSVTVATAAGANASLTVTDFTGLKVVPLAAAAATNAGTATQATSALAWREGTIVASPSGEISLIDSKTAALKAEPFQLRLRPGQRLENLRLAAVGEKGSQFLVADGEQALYVIGLADGAGQQLVELASAKLEAPPISGLAVGENNFVGLVDRRGQLVTFTVPELKPVASLDLKAQAIVAGPTRIGDVVVLATDRDELVGLDRSLGQAWKVPLPHGPPAGDVVADGANIVLACQTGWLCRIDATSGAEIAAVDLGQSLAGTPLVVGGKVIVPTADGAILRVTLPTEKEAAP